MRSVEVLCGWVSHKTFPLRAQRGGTWQSIHGTSDGQHASSQSLALVVETRESPKKRTRMVSEMRQDGTNPAATCGMMGWEGRSVRFSGKATVQAPRGKVRCGLSWLIENLSSVAHGSIGRRQGKRTWISRRKGILQRGQDGILRLSDLRRLAKRAKVTPEVEYGAQGRREWRECCVARRKHQTPRS